MNGVSRFKITVLCGLIICLSLHCQNGEKPEKTSLSVPSIPTPHNLTNAALSRLRHFDGKKVDADAWSSIEKNVDTTQLPEIHFLTGNLDCDPEAETIVWYRKPADNTIGLAYWLDKNPAGWALKGSVDLIFWRGDDPPRLDTAGKMLLVYEYGSGSGYGAQILHFYQDVQDSIVLVFEMVENEFELLDGSSIARHITGNYRLLPNHAILTAFKYELMDAATKRLIFTDTVSMVNIWDVTKVVYVPTLPSGFLEEFLEEHGGENGYQFDQYFKPKIRSIKEKGPAWKRKILRFWDTE